MLSIFPPVTSASSKPITTSSSAPTASKPAAPIEMRDAVSGAALKQITNDYIDMLEADTHASFTQAERDEIATKLRVQHATHTTATGSVEGYSIYAPQGKIQVAGKIIVPINTHMVLPKGLSATMIGSRFLIFDTTVPLNATALSFLDWCEHKAIRGISRYPRAASVITRPGLPPLARAALGTAGMVVLFKSADDLVDLSSPLKTTIGWEEISFMPGRPLMPIYNPTARLTTPAVDPSDPKPMVTPIADPIHSGILPGRTIGDPGIAHGMFTPGYHAHQGKVEDLTKKASSLPYKPEEISGKIYHKRFGNFYNQKGSDLWITKDINKHGGSMWKAYKKHSDKLQWLYDADKDLKPIPNKHKSKVGKEIPIKEFSGISGYKGL